MDDGPHDPVVAERQQLLPRSVPGVPAAEGSCGLVRKHDVVLGVVEHGLNSVLLKRVIVIRQLLNATVKKTFHPNV